MSWSLQGSYFESCNCTVACPCVFLSAPTDGECTVLIAWHIDEGRDGEVALDGLNAALAVHSPGHMAEVEWRAALYLDERADEAQKQALTRIFGGHAGGHFERLASHVGEVIGVTSTGMDYRAEGRRRSIDIAGVASAEIEAIEGQGGGEATVSGHPLCVVPGEPAVVARSKRLSYADHGMNWTLSNKNGFYSPFAYQGD